MERVLDLTLKLADEGLTPEELGELERLIEAEPLARRRHLQMLEVEATLRASAHARPSDALVTAPSTSLALERRVASVLKQVRRPPLLAKRGRRLIAGLAVAVAAAAALVLVLRPGRHRADGTPGAFARLDSRPVAHAEAVAPVRRWSPGVFPVRAAGPADRFNMDLGDGTSLEVRGRAVLGVERATGVGDGSGPRITLDEGIIAFQRGTGAQAAITTRQAEILVRSGRALVTATTRGTRVDLMDGQATVSAREGDVTRLTAHQSATLTADRTTVVPMRTAVLVGNGMRAGVPGQFVDQLLLRRMEDLGFAVDAVDERDVRVEHFQGHAIVVISPTTTGRIADKVQELSLYNSTVPIVCSRPKLFADLGMTAGGPGTANYTNQKNMLTMLADEHPLAAGLRGEVQVFDANMNLGWGVPAPGAAKIAVVRNRADHSPLFAFERDAPMLPPANRAPARRVGFFLHPVSARFMNDHAWQLFDAAVKWAAEGAP